MTSSQHAWVVEVLHDILLYADKFDLVALRDNCQLAYDAARDEVGQPPADRTQLARQQGFIDAIRELIDYSETENLPRTRLFLMQALATAAAHWDNPNLSGTVIHFPVRDPDKS